MEAVTNSTEIKIQTNHDPQNNGSSSSVPFSSSSSASAVFRKIEFHPARKPFTGFSKGGSNFKIETLNPISTNNRSISKNPVGSNSSEYGLDPELSFSITIRKIGAGLENLGNTCFLNSVLQCLTYTEPLANYLQKIAHEKRCHVAGFCALCAMQKHVRTARQATGRILAPKDLVSNLRCVSRNFRNCRQEDAHEYMINLLECMHKCCLPSGVPSESSDAYKNSLVHRIFGGSLRSQVKCEQCSHCSNKFDPFLDLSLDISKADSLKRALSRFTAIELLDDGAKVYQCERCKQKVKAKKQLTVSKAPSVLTVHLKRFESHRSEKIDRKVQFDSSIDMKPFVSGTHEGNLKYTLYGVLVHYGRSTHSGHYACFVRTSTGMWYSLDDNRVVQVSEKTVFNQKAYMLFYVRDGQSVAPKNAVTVAKNEAPKPSLVTNRGALVISSYRNDQVNGSTVLKACSSGPLVANSAPVVLTPKDINAKETRKDSSSIVEEKEIPKKENSSVPLKLGAPAVLTQKDSNTKETVQKEVSLPKANGEVSLSNEDSKVACAMSPLTDGRTNTQSPANLPTSGAKAENSVEERKSVSNLIEPASSVKVKSVSVTNSHVEEAVPANKTSSPRKSRKRNIKSLKMGLTFFKLSLGVRKKKKQRKGRSSTLPVKLIAEEVLSKSRATDQEHSTSEDLKERTNENGTNLAEASLNAKRKRESSKEEQISLQKEEETILTRGLPVTVVAKWDEEVPSSKNMRKSQDMKIGYVADEWDEEYDKGKKKKIRLKEEMYTGANPFQLVAMKKQRDAEKKLNQQMNTAKTAFRI